MRAVRRLEDSGVGFTITSSRPTIGMRFLIEPLQITLPVGPFNGSSICDPQMNPVEQHLIPAAAAQRSLDMLNEFGVDIWLFTNDQWLARQWPTANMSRFEQRTIRADPTIVDDFTPYLSAACKIVGSSADAALLQRCEAAMREALGDAGHRGPIAELLSRHHPARPATRAPSCRRWRSGWHFDRRGRDHRRHA